MNFLILLNALAVLEGERLALLPGIIVVRFYNFIDRY